ncbi:nuclear transport factor 2 family protein [Geodermatophilus sp. URMC 63]
MAADPAADVRAVVDTTVAMAVLADERDWAALTALFTDEVTADYTASTGGTPGPVRAADLVAGWTGSLTTFVVTHHLVTNHRVTLQGDRAVAHAYFQATHVRPDRSTWVLGGRYRYALVREGDRWRIAAVTMTPSWALEGVDTLPRPEGSSDAG